MRRLSKFRCVVRLDESSAVVEASVDEAAHGLPSLRREQLGSRVFGVARHGDSGSAITSSPAGRHRLRMKPTKPERRGRLRPSEVRPSVPRRLPKSFHTAPARSSGDQPAPGKDPWTEAIHPSPRTDSNRGPLPYHGSALPTELRGRSPGAYRVRGGGGPTRRRPRAAGPPPAQWRGQDSNLRRQSQRVYSASPLTAREPRRGRSV
jgi:hypothetical protein